MSEVYSIFRKALVDHLPNMPGADREILGLTIASLIESHVERLILERAKTHDWGMRVAIAEKNLSSVSARLSATAREVTMHMTRAAELQHRVDDLQKRLDRLEPK